MIGLINIAFYFIIAYLTIKISLAQLNYLNFKIHFDFFQPIDIKDLNFMFKCFAYEEYLNELESYKA